MSGDLTGLCLYMVSKNLSVCLSVCKNFLPQLSQDWQNSFCRLQAPETVFSKIFKFIPPEIKNIFAVGHEPRKCFSMHFFQLYLIFFLPLLNFNC